MSAPAGQRPIAVIGLGPTGGALALLLAKYGCEVCLVEREHAVRQLPRAVFFDDEVMRVLQHVGLSEALLPSLKPVGGMDLVDDAGQVLYRYRPAATTGALAWAEGYMFQQPVLEQLLWDAVARHPRIRVHTGIEVDTLEHTHDGVIVTGRDAGGHAHRLEAAVVVGCDGARSLVRRHMPDVTLQCLGEDSRWLVVDLTDVQGPALPDVTMQYCDPRRPATSVPLPGGDVRFELCCMPGDALATMASPESVAALLAPWIAPGSYRIARATVYTFHSLLADRWRDGRVFIAGDAAHQMPPFLGQGMGTGIRDAANLAWKLALVQQGRAHPTLLDSYEAERSPMTRQVITTDLKLGALIQTTDAEVAARRNAEARQLGGAVPLTPPRFAIGSALGVGTPPAGLPFPQWHTTDGRTDALLGPMFTLVGPVVPSPSTRALMECVGMTVVPDLPAAMRAFLSAHGAVGALVRPDRVLHALVHDAAELDALWASIATHVVAEAAVR